MVQSKKKSVPFYIQILFGLIIGVVLGLVAMRFTEGEKIITDWIKPWGQLFIKLLQLVAIPLVFFSLIKGIMNLGDVRKFSRMGLKTIIIYLITTVIAILLGMAMAGIVNPGTFFDAGEALNLEITFEEQVQRNIDLGVRQEQLGPLNFLNDIIPDNIVGAASSNRNMLQIIFFAVLFAIAALFVSKEKMASLLNLIDAITEVILKMIDLIIKTAPWGVGALMAGLIVEFSGNLSVFGALAVYAVLVIIALLILIFAFYPLLIRFFTDIPVKNFIKKIYPVQLLAFTTSSSAATLPLTMEVAEKELNISEETASFVLPVGTTINMDGTSCFQAISIFFIAQVLGIDLTIPQLLTVILMTAVSSIGTPAIPGGSYVILTMVLTSVGIPAEGMALILAVDRPLDMLRTSVNVTGDLTVAGIIDKSKKLSR